MGCISERYHLIVFLTTVLNINFGIQDYLIHCYLVKMQMPLLLDFKFDEVRGHAALLSVISPWHIDINE